MSVVRLIKIQTTTQYPTYPLKCLKLKRPTMPNIDKDDRTYYKSHTLLLGV